MKILNEIKKVKWLYILFYYSIILIGTYFARKLPNLIRLFLAEISDIPFTFNYNHGFVVLLVSLIFYKFRKVKQEITLLGNREYKSVLFPIVLFSCYSVYGMNNNNGVDIHLWAFIFCLSAFIYNLMEEYAWRGYLIENLGMVNFILKSVISGVFWAVWHLLIFSNFDQYGGFWIFLAFCIVFSFILTFAVLRTKSIIVAGAIHAFIIQINIVALICFIIFMILLLTWDKTFIKENNIS